MCCHQVEGHPRHVCLFFVHATIDDGSYSGDLTDHTGATVTVGGGLILNQQDPKCLGQKNVLVSTKEGQVQVTGDA